MSADLSRDSFHRRNHYLQVVLQQGRVLLDADFNEQAAIQLYRLRQLARDLRGPHWGPSAREFQIQPMDKPDDLQISPGHYCVDGLLCENERLTNYSAQPDYGTQPDFPVPPVGKPPYLVYAEVWLRELSGYEAGDAATAGVAFDPLVQDPALGHLDTTTRTRVVWQVKLLQLDNPIDPFIATVKDATQALTVKEFEAFEKVLLDHNRRRKYPGRMAAQVRQRNEQTDQQDLCASDAEFGYRGADNQLFRVEIHAVEPDRNQFAFKWAPDNASAIFPVVIPDNTNIGSQSILTLHLLGSAGGPRPTLHRNDWVEFVDDAYALRMTEPKPIPARPFLRVKDVDLHEGTIVLDTQGSSMTLPTAPKHPLLRRWQHKPKWVTLGDNKWIDLGDGVQVRFDNTPVGKDQNNRIPRLFRRGDYWMIPARTSTRDVIWPTTSKDGARVVVSLHPHNPPPAYAPLLLVDHDGWFDLRRIFDRDAKPPDGRIAKPESKPATQPTSQAAE